MRDDIAGANATAPMIAYSLCLSDAGFHPTVRNLPAWCEPAFGKAVCSSAGQVRENQPILSWTPSVWKQVPLKGKVLCSLLPEMSPLAASENYYDIKYGKREQKQQEIWHSIHLEWDIKRQDSALEIAKQCTYHGSQAVSFLLCSCRFEARIIAKIPVVHTG